MAIEFNTEFYLQSKFNQLESEGLLEQFELTDVASLAQFFEDNGVDAREHYLAVGMAEGINPSAEFDTNAYLEAKLADLQNADKYGDEFADFTVQDVIEAFQASGLTALEHFNEFGEAEGLEATPVEEEASELTEALGQLQAEQANLAAKLAEIATADATDETEADGVAALDPESATYEADLKAFVDGYDSEDAVEEAAAAAQAVEDAQADIDAANGALLNAQAATVAGTADGNAVVAGLESFTASTRATDANIARAVTEAQALVEADEASYTETGAKVSGDGVEPEAGYVALYTDGSTVQTTEAQGFELIGFANEKASEAGTPVALNDAQTAAPSDASALVVSYGLTFAVANGSTEAFSVIIDSVSYTVNVTADSGGAITAATFVSDPATANDKIASTELTIGSGASLTITGEPGAANSFTYSDASGDALSFGAQGVPSTPGASDAVAEVVTIQGGTTVDANFTGEIQLTVDSTQYSVAVTDGVFDAAALAAIESETNIATAEQNGFDLVLTGVVDAGLASDFTVAASDAVPAIDASYSETDLIDVFSAKELQTLAAEAQADLNTDVANDGDNVALLSSLKDALVTFIANGGTSTTDVAGYNVNGAMSNVQAAALIDNITGLLDQSDEDDVAADADAFVQTLTVNFAATDPANPTDNEQLLINALETITDRPDLENGVTNAENALDATESGAVLAAANNLQDGRDQLIQNITDAQDDKVAAEDYKATIDALVAEHDAIVGNIEAAQQRLADLGVENLVELESADTGGTLLGADLFVYTEQTKDLTISRLEADDQLFLGDFARIDLGADDDLSTDRLGDSAVFEFFVEQNGSNVNLYIETQTFAGNDTGAIAASDFTTITLTGVNAEDLVFENGFLTIA